MTIKTSSTSIGIRYQSFITIRVVVDSIIKAVIAAVMMMMMWASFSSVSEGFHAIENMVAYRV